MKKLLIFGLIITLLFLVGCVQKETQASLSVEITIEEPEPEVTEEPEPEVPAITKINLNVLTKEWSIGDEGQEIVTLKTRELEKGYKFTGSNCFLCGTQLFTLEDIISENEILLAYEDALTPTGGGENPILIGNEGKCFHVESLDLGLDICIEIA